MTHSRTRNLLIITALMLTACGASSTTPDAARPTVTPIPVYEYNAPTEPPQLATVAALTQAAGETGGELNPEQVERGLGRYVALECGVCHGENGEGTDDGPPLAGLALSEEDFISFMRSGGSLGADHQYSTNRLSDSGGRNLYQYLLSLNE